MGVTEFKTNFSGGTRQNRFVIEGTFPGGQFNKFHIRSTQIPQVSAKSLTYEHFGRKYHYPGEKEYGTWSFTVLDDHGTDSVNLWKAFQSWQNLINEHDTNISQEIKGNSTYKADGWRIKHLGINGESVGERPLKSFILNGCWPQVIQPINFSMTNSSLLNSFIVVIVYDSIEIDSITAS
jgi:hypothetical protein